MMNTDSDVDQLWHDFDSNTKSQITVLVKDSMDCLLSMRNSPWLYNLPSCR